MARRKLTLEDRIKGARALLRSTKKVPEHFKKPARELLKKHGYAVALAFALLLLPSSAHAQREQVRYAAAFYQSGANPTVAAMVTAAQNSCISDTNIPCIVVIDSTLAAYTAGSLPTPCTQCLWLDYRTPGKVQYASAAQTTLKDFGTPSFPLAAPQASGPTCAGVPYSFTTSTTTGIDARSATPELVFCVGGSRDFAILTTHNLIARSGLVFGWSSSSTDSLAAALDTGLSRGAANEVDCGNGTAADKSCTFKAANIVLTGTCTGCGGATVVASGTSTMAASSVSSGTCATVVTTAATNTLTTDAIEWAFASAPSAAQDGKFTTTAYVTANNVNFLVCNNWSTAATPTGLVINWRVIR